MIFSIVGKGISGVSVARFLKRRKQSFFFLDDSSKTLNEYNILHSREVILSPGISVEHKAIQAAIKYKMKIWNEIDISIKSIPACFNVGVTGSNGKSTTTSMLGFLFIKVFNHVFVGGNLGIPLSQCLEWGKKLKFIIMELSSFQLEIIKDLKLDIANLSNLSPNHLNRHKTVKEYYRTKRNIFKLLKDRGVGFDLSFPLLRKDIKKKYTNRLNLLGKHNMQNICLNILNSQLVEITEEAFQKSVKMFMGILHRLEVFGQRRGALWVNDSKSTSVFSQIAAITCFAGTVHFVLGGVGKGVDYTSLERLMISSVVFFYVIGTESLILLNLLKKRKLNVVCVGNLDNAIFCISKRIRVGDVVLFSPGCASFDQFINYEQRGFFFRRLYHAV
ncbi:MAG: hypothetical protein HYS16_01155 [Deltaproteobacteria bacterium]|nr:MAG: hypothetical protein HYS16_01155 [Deltaproteobacteria bacterium]